MSIKGIIFTSVFESAAINRDEKLAGNIASIKKLTRNHEIFSFMSRPFIAHHLFASLYLLHDWNLASVTVDKNVLQFNFPEDNIISTPELDLRGFMRTSPFTATRKGPLGITKAISLEPWAQDMSFYANHDMVRRAKEKVENAQPNPYSKEEHYSYYKVSFTLDISRFGVQDIYFNNGDIEKSATAFFKKRLSKENIGKKELEEKLSKLKDELSEEDKIKDWLNISKSSIDEIEKEISDKEKYKDFDDIYRYNGKGSGFVLIKPVNSYKRIKFLITDEERKKRLKQFIDVMKNGIMIHSSTENYGLIPAFQIVSTLKLPVPVFNSAIVFNEKGIKAECINKALGNGYVIDAWYDHYGYPPIEGELNKKLKEWTSVEDVTEKILSGVE